MYVVRPRRELRPSSSRLPYNKLDRKYQPKSNPVYMFLCIPSSPPPRPTHTKAAIFFLGHGNFCCIFLFFYAMPTFVISKKAIFPHPPYKTCLVSFALPNKIDVKIIPSAVHQLIRSFQKQSSRNNTNSWSGRVGAPGFCSEVSIVKPPHLKCFFLTQFQLYFYFFQMR